MGGGGGSPQPDWAGIMAAQAAMEQTRVLGQIAQENMAWSKEQYYDAKATNKPIIEEFTKSMQLQNDFAGEQQKFYTENYQPLEKDLVDTANNWDTPERRDMMAGEAAADVAQQFEGARQAAEQQLKDFGVDPSSPKYAATNLGAKLAQAQAAAGAQNMARRNVEMQGIQLKQNAVNTGRGYPGNINQSWGSAQGSGNSAIQGTNNTTQLGSNMMGTPVQWYGLQNQALGTWGNIANNNYKNYLDGYQIQQKQNSSGIGQIAGLAGGLISSFLADGGAVPAHASPTKGAAVDDVPARLTAGEFVIPKRAVEWLGEKTLHQLISKSDKEREQVMAQSGAVPEQGVVPREQPRFVSRSEPRAALPVG